MTQVDNRELERRIGGVLSDVFGVDPAAVGPDTSKDTVVGWDSLQHLTLILALEEEFGIHFDDEESVTLVNYPLIVTIVSERLAATG